jgi:hypothetical protein
MGNDTSRAVGTDFELNRRNRDRDNSADSLPTIPFMKQKRVNEEMTATIKASIFFQNYKRAFRGYLRRNPERNQLGSQMRLHFNSLRDADLLGLDKDRYKELIDAVVIKMAPDLSGDIIDYLVEKGKLKPNADDLEKTRAAEDSLTTIFGYLGDEIIEKTGKKLYETYSRGADFEASDQEVDPEKMAKLQAAKAERLRKAAEERQKAADQFMKDAAEEEEAQQRRLEAIAQREAEQKAIQQANEANML